MSTKGRAGCNARFQTSSMRNVFFSDTFNIAFQVGPLEPRSGLFAQVAGDSVFILNVFRRRDLDLADVIPLCASEHKGKAVHKARGISKECHVGNGGRSEIAMLEFSSSITFFLNTTIVQTYGFRGAIFIISDFCPSTLRQDWLSVGLSPRALCLLFLWASARCRAHNAEAQAFFLRRETTPRMKRPVFPRREYKVSEGACFFECQEFGRRTICSYSATIIISLQLPRVGRFCSVGVARVFCSGLRPRRALAWTTRRQCSVRRLDRSQSDASCFGETSFRATLSFSFTDVRWATEHLGMGSALSNTNWWAQISVPHLRGKRGVHAVLCHHSVRLASGIPWSFDMAGSSPRHSFLHQEISALSGASFLQTPQC